MSIRFMNMMIQRWDKRLFLTSIAFTATAVMNNRPRQSINHTTVVVPGLVLVAYFELVGLKVFNEAFNTCHSSAVSVESQSSVSPVSA